MSGVTELAPPAGTRPPIVGLHPGSRPRLASALGCHGILDRRPVVAGRRLPLCARCLGFVAGNLVAAATWAALGAPGAAAALAGLALVLPAALDGGLQAATGYRSGNGRRLATGLAAGFGQVTLLAAILVRLAT